MEDRERLARLEEKTTNIEKNLNRLEGKVDAAFQRLDTRIDGLDQKIGEVKDSVSTLAVTVEKSLGWQRVWFLLIGAGLLTVIARAFHWL